MGRAHRIGDTNTGGGAITCTLQSSVFVNNLLAAVDGSQGTAHNLCSNNIHCAGNCISTPDRWKTNGGCPTVFVEGLPKNHAGNVDTCGHARDENGSPNVFVCAFKGEGVNVDLNPPYFPPGAIEPIFDPISNNAQPSPPAGYGTNTLADVHVYDQNDDPDGTLGSPPTLTVVNQNAVILEEDPTEAPTNSPPTQDCSIFDSLPADFNWKTFYSGSPGPPVPATFTDWATNPAEYPEAQLSPNFTVGDLTINTAVSYYEFTTSVTQASGLSQKQILQNLCFLAKTILEPMLSTYGSFDITSCFRNKSDSSQHSLGQAADIQFSGLSGSGYFTRAQEVRDTFNFDQFILEWFGRNPWFHISANSSSHRNSVLTQVSSNSFQSGLKRIGV